MFLKRALENFGSLFHRGLSKGLSYKRLRIKRAQIFSVLGLAAVPPRTCLFRQQLLSRKFF
jgi:hypothetical protein